MISPRGATPWTETLAETLRLAGTPVVLIDTFAGALVSARAKGIPSLQAELLSEQGMESMREHRIDYLFAATQNDIYNSLVCSKLAPEIGRGKVFQLAAAGEALEERNALDKEWRGHVVGTPPLSFADIGYSRQAAASAILLEKFEADEDVGDDEMAMLIVRTNGDLLFVSAEMPKAELVEGDRILLALRKRSSSIAA